MRRPKAMKSLAVLGLAAASLVGASMLSASDAQACLRSMADVPVQPAVINKPADVAWAERALDNGQTRLAAVKVATAFPGLRTASPGGDPLATRALRIMALAEARTEGNIPAPGFRVATAADRLANVEWAVATLTRNSQLRANDPAMQADLAESMGHIAARQREALTILSGLADKDLMGSPHAYAMLARLRQSTGDAAGSAVALRRCEQLASDATICKAPGGRGVPVLRAAARS